MYVVTGNADERARSKRARDPFIRERPFSHAFAEDVTTSDVTFKDDAVLICLL